MVARCGDAFTLRPPRGDGRLLSPSLSAQVDELSRSLPEAVQRVQARMTRSEWTRQALANAPPAKDFMPDRPDVLAKVTGVFSNTLGALANFVIVIAIGIYLAADPDAYVHGFARLFPKPRRARVLEVLAAIGTTLRWWLMGKFLSMIVVGVLTAAGLWLLGIPLA